MGIHRQLYFAALPHKVMDGTNTQKRANEAGPPEDRTTTTTSRNVEVYTSSQEHQGCLTASPLWIWKQEEAKISTDPCAIIWSRQGSHHRPTSPAVVLFSPVFSLVFSGVVCWVTCVFRWHGFVGDRVHGIESIKIVPTHPMLALGTLRDIRSWSLSNNILDLGAFMDMGGETLEKFPWADTLQPPPLLYIFLARRRAYMQYVLRE